MSIEEATWPHKFSKEQLDAWKEKYGRVLMTTISSQSYVYRGLTNAEFEKLRDEERQFIANLEQNNISQEDISQQTITNSMKAVVLTCLLYPEDYKDKLSSDLAGVLEVLQPAILEASGFPNEVPEVQTL